MKPSNYVRVCIITLILSMVAPSMLPFNNVLITEAATIKINKKTLAIEIGKSVTLKLSGTKKKVTWSSGNKAIATVSNSGKVTGIKIGKTTISATLDKKNYTCSVTVNQNSAVANAPFDAQLIKTSDFLYVIPKDWTKYELEGTSAYFKPTSSKEGEDSSSVQIYIEKSGIDTSNYEVMKDILSEQLTEEYVTDEFTQNLIETQIISEDAKIEYLNYKTSDYQTTIGTAFKINFDINIEGMARKEAIYYLYLNQYYIILHTDDIDDNISPDAINVGDYILSSMQLVK